MRGVGLLITYSVWRNTAATEQVHPVMGRFVS